MSNQKNIKISHFYTFPHNIEQVFAIFTNVSTFTNVVYKKFVMTGSIAASGNVMSLLNFSDTLPDNAFNRLFKDCTSLTTTPELPTTLAPYCYGNMFEGCTSLTTAPSLPATTLNYRCYYEMFKNCTSLTTVPQLPATTLSSDSYSYMFDGCTSLKVYSTSGEGHDKAWSIPTEGVFSTSTTASSQINMFNGVETDNVPANFPGTQGQQFTYYTQNQPV